MVEAKIFKLYNRFIHLRDIENGALVLFEVSSPPGIPKVTYKQYINKSGNHLANALTILFTEINGN